MISQVVCDYWSYLCASHPDPYFKKPVPFSFNSRLSPDRRCCRQSKKARVIDSLINRSQIAIPSTADVHEFLGQTMTSHPQCGHSPMSINAQEDAVRFSTTM
ncbi:hypothetical protein TNCV_2575221 [Trichonephila clavipes]|uniref:Uncharacterized protein n=1 Tax=Trichonephila clavipes TaxID=2585209 RepID=A0A8X6RE96_TRICX|nr:hypothetical protein TNCV_2575221 [Trichonephila clavipes]